MWACLAQWFMCLSCFVANFQTKIKAFKMTCSLFYFFILRTLSPFVCFGEQGKKTLVFCSLKCNVLDLANCKTHRKICHDIASMIIIKNIVIGLTIVNLFWHQTKWCLLVGTYTQLTVIYRSVAHCAAKPFFHCVWSNTHTKPPPTPPTALIHKHNINPQAGKMAGWALGLSHTWAMKFQHNAIYFLP